MNNAPKYVYITKKKKETTLVTYKWNIKKKKNWGNVVIAVVVIHVVLLNVSCAVKTGIWIDIYSHSKKLSFSLVSISNVSYINGALSIKKGNYASMCVSLWKRKTKLKFFLVRC